MVFAYIMGTSELGMSKGGFFLRKLLLFFVALCWTSMAWTIRSPAALAAKPEQLRLSFAGDCTLGGDSNKLFYPQSLLTVVNDMGMDWPFSGTYDVFANDDLSLVNLEGVFTNSRKAAVKTFTFRAPPEYADILVQGSIEAVNLANNHTMDYLERGLKDTKAALDARGIAYCQSYEPTVVEAKGLRIALLGLTYPLRKVHLKALYSDIEAFRAQGIDLIVVSFHWGKELSLKQNLDQVAVAHATIDHGADIVVGTHPHVLQGMEVYKNKPIFYSLGNFSFGGNVSPRDIDTAIIQTTYDITDSGLQLARLEVFPCAVTSNALGESQDYRPVFVSGEAAQRVLKKLSYRAAGLPEDFFSTGIWVLRP